jgi:hypothetical protein
LTTSQDTALTVHMDPSRWVIADQSGEALEPTRLMKTLIKVSYDADFGGVCLMLPVSEGVDQLAAITTAIARMKADCEKMTNYQEQRTFVEGQRVKTLPDGFVYEVAGKISERTGEHEVEGYWLQRLDRPKGQDGGRFLIRKSDFHRFEATNRKRPIGREKQKWSPIYPTPIDHLACTKTFGNLLLQRNRVIFLGPKSDIEAGLCSLKLWRPELLNGHAWPDLSDWVAWGGLDEDGRAYVESIGDAFGEPLVAATRDFQAAREAGRNAEPGSLLFVTRSIDACLRNIETVSRLAERHRFVLLATGRDREKVAPFQKEGWLVWELNPTELLDTNIDRKPELRALRTNIEAAVAEQSLSTTFHQVCDPNLAECKAALAALGESVSRTLIDEVLDDRVEDIIADLWEIFLVFCSWLRFPTQADLNAQAEHVAQLKLTNSMLKPVMPHDAWEPSRLAIQGLRAFLESGAPGIDTPKGLALFDTVAKEKPDRLIIGSLKDVKALKEWAAELLLDVRIEVAGVGEIVSAQTALALSLMSRRSFEKLVDPIPASRLCFVGYDFECDTYMSRLRWRTKRRKALRPDREFQERVIGTVDETGLEKPAANSDLHEASTGPDRFEQGRRPPKLHVPVSLGPSEHSREGRLCVFEGCSWAVFTTGHGLSVVSESGEKTIERKTLDDLMVGDRLIIREAGQKDVIRLLAEDMIGNAEYDQIWQKSRKWRKALLRISNKPADLWQKLSWGGLHRDRVTIRGWLLDDSTIGPKNRDDITIIAELADDEPDAKTWTECWEAINKLRSVHMQAGMRLGRLLHEECQGLLDISIDKENAMQLSLGLVWLVQVREIHEIADWPSNIVNHLRWGNDAWQSRMKSVLNDVGSDPWQQ